MSYLTQSQLANDPEFQPRTRAAGVEQAGVFKDDARADIAACADAVLKDDAGVVNCFIRLAAAGPGIAAKVDNGDGTIDQSQVSDADLLALTQANWPTVAELFYATDGTRLP